MPRHVLAAALSLAWSASAAAAGADPAIAFNSHCRTCHSSRPNDHRLGPSLANVFGSKAGTAIGYRGYSGALSGLTWDEATLDRFISDPASLATSTNMIYPPVRDAGVRAQIIAFLKSISAR
jgi:cytochrome c